MVQKSDISYRHLLCSVSEIYSVTEESLVQHIASASQPASKLYSWSQLCLIYTYNNLDSFCWSILPNCNIKISLHRDFINFKTSRNTEFSKLSKQCMHVSNACYKQTLRLYELTFHAPHRFLTRNSNCFWPESRIFKILSASVGRRLRPTVLLFYHNETLHQKDVFHLNRKLCFLLDTLKTTYWIFIIVHKPGTKIFHGMHWIPDKCKAEFWPYKDIMTEHPTPLLPRLIRCQEQNGSEIFFAWGIRF